MRTKSLLAAAAIVAVGALSLQAQNVYSLNVVGYVNVTLKPGYNLISAPLKTASATAEIATVLTNITGLPDGSTFVSWNPTTQDFNQAANWVAAAPDTGWYNADYTALSTSTAPRGTGFFINNAGGTDATLTLVGEVPQGPNTIGVVNGYNYLADFVPAAGDAITNGFPVADGSTVSTFNAVAQEYTQALNGIATPPDGPAFYNGDFTAVVPFVPSVAQGFFYTTTAGAATWNRNFTVQ